PVAALFRPRCAPPWPLLMAAASLAVAALVPSMLGRGAASRPRIRRGRGPPERTPVRLSHEIDGYDEIDELPQLRRRPKERDGRRRPDPNSGSEALDERLGWPPAAALAGDGDSDEADEATPWASFVEFGYIAEVLH